MHVIHTHTHIRAYKRTYTLIHAYTRAQIHQCETRGDILVFLTGEEEIEDVCRRVRSEAEVRVCVCACVRVCVRGWMSAYTDW